MSKADIGLIGLAVMGENLVLNIESHGFTVAVFNRTTDKVDEFINGRGAGKSIIGSRTLSAGPGIWKTKVSCTSVRAYPAVKKAPCSAPASCLAAARRHGHM
jgi:glutamyl-tRNA reductase